MSEFDDLALNARLEKTSRAQIGISDKHQFSKDDGVQRVPDLNGFSTPERLRHAGNGVSAGEVKPRIGPSIVNSPIRPKNAPPHAKQGALEQNLDKHEQHVLTRFLAAALTVNGRAKVSSYDGGSLSKGSKAEGELPYTDEEQHMIEWYNQIMKRLPHRTQCGLQLLYKIYLGENNGVSLDDIGRSMTRHDDKNVIKGGYITFFRMVVQDIELAEKTVSHIHIMRKQISNAVN